MKSLENYGWWTRYELEVTVLWEAAKGLRQVEGQGKCSRWSEEDIPEWEDSGGIRLELYNFSGQNKNYTIVYSIVYSMQYTNQYSIQFLIRTRFWPGDLIYSISSSPHSGHLMQRTDSLEKTLMLGNIEGRRRRGWQRMRWLDGITHSTHISLNKLGKLMMDREVCHAVAHGVAKSRNDWVTELNWSGPQVIIFVLILWLWKLRLREWSNSACAAHLGKGQGIWSQVCLTPQILL